MPRVWVSVGSNIDRERHTRAALEELRAMFGDLIVSPLYEARAVGFEGDAFFNLVVGFDTELPPSRLHELLRGIESHNGRVRGGEKLAPRTIDLDLLTYGDALTDEGGKRLPRDEILHYAFVLAPLADVAGDERHPQLGDTYRSLWERLLAAGEGQGLRRLPDPAWLRSGGGADA
jgi:2-amino-4-hydroxy-6-hydroxymethyldihydropteridine diphosphokinase